MFVYVCVSNCLGAPESVSVYLSVSVCIRLLVVVRVSLCLLPC